MVGSDLEKVENIILIAGMTYASDFCAVPVYSGLLSCVVDHLNRNSIGEYGQPRTSRMASTETGNYAISVTYCDIVTILMAIPMVSGVSS